MEPFLAPGEREHIAKMLDIPLPQRQYAPPPQYAPPQYAPPQRPAQGPQAMPNLGGMGDTMQLMQLLSSLGGMGKSGGSPLGQSGGGMNPLMLAQLLGNMMGRR